MRNKISIYYLLGLIVLVIFASCTNNILYKQYYKFEKISWNRFEFLNFEMPVEASSQEYDIYLSVRHLPEFAYRELEVNFTLFFPSGEMRTADHVLKFIDNDGERLSECLGDFCDIDFLIRKGIVFNEQGIVKFEIENKNTRLETPGMMEVGIIVRKSE
ncbi:MAG: hypothetical protein JW731_12865 [Bacteroidales bacterium]|nr:hypothetical protein [Bacteroidales bacterium]